MASRSNAVRATLRRAAWRSSHFLSRSSREITVLTMSARYHRGFRRGNVAADTISSLTPAAGRG